MRPVLLHGALLALAGSMAAVACLRWRSAIPRVAPPVAPSLAAPAPSQIATDSALAEAESLVVENDPFRLANAPAHVDYDPHADGVPGTNHLVLPARVRPSFVLRAIVGGPPWQAIIDGIPAQPAGSVVRAGATFDRLVVRSVTRDSVVIQAPDTTWVLAFGKRP